MAASRREKRGTGSARIYEAFLAARQSEHDKTVFRSEVGLHHVYDFFMQKAWGNICIRIKTNANIHWKLIPEENCPE
jgi:hypothetical protein